jgi:glutathione synthase
MLETSTAAQCPSVAYQLAGAKKVQQDLASPGVLERFVDGPEEAALIRACFAGELCCARLVGSCISC